MQPRKRTIYTMLAAFGISLGAAGLASAASSTISTNSPSVTEAIAAATAATTTDSTPTAASVDSSTTDATTDANDATHDSPDDAPSYTSSVTIPVAADGSKPTDAELQAVATVTAEQATAAALANTPGTAGTAELKRKGGNVVWEVDVTATAGGDFDVIVDAGNATILDTHVEGGGGGHHGRGHDDGNEVPSYTSSVTIPVAADGSKPTDAELQAVATVTAEQATAAALANTPGTAGTAELKSKGGNVVWEVDVTASAGGDFDVIVDAGNATILDTHVEGGGGGGGHHGHDGGDETDDDATTATTTG